ncbi:MAG: hypothetical protein PW788_08260 [Micavibrio sp.]|nr:hypothetical protein [Micavibrio sp.]
MSANPAITVKAEFHKLTEDDVVRAISQDEDNPIAEELARVIDELAAACATLIRQGKEPDALLSRPPSCALEKIALELVAEAVGEESGREDGDDEDEEDDEE